MKVEIELEEKIYSFLEKYSSLKNLTVTELVQGLVISDVRGLIDDLSTEETANLLGLQQLF